MFNFSFFRMGFYQRLLLILSGVFVYILPETLAALTGAVLSENKDKWLSFFGFCCMVSGFLGIGRTIGSNIPPAKNKDSANK